MLTYKDFTQHFGTSLFNKGFQAFLSGKFSDLSAYDILKSDYITSDNSGIDLGFTNNDAVYDDDGNIVLKKGNPIFSHFILYPKSILLIGNLPFEAAFNDSRIEIIRKAGNPDQTNEGYADFLGKEFLVDNYKVDDIVITFDFNPQKQTINFIQVRDNNLVKHLKL